MAVDESSEDEMVEKLRGELAKLEPTRRKRIIDKMVLAALGSIPWVGSFISAAYDYKAAEGGIKQDSLQTRWLEEHQEKLRALKATLAGIEARFDSLGDQIDDRIQTPEYLGLVRGAFRVWNDADTDEKRRYAANVVTNAADSRVCSDDVVRLFISWLDLYHEAHFAVIQAIYKGQGVTRYGIWNGLYGALPREDSAEADLFKLLIRDLSTDGVIRQERDVDMQGRFLKSQQRRPTVKGYVSQTTESAFEDTKVYVLTELGKQFVHYTMTDVVTRLGGSDASSSPG